MAKRRGSLGAVGRVPWLQALHCLPWKSITDEPPMSINPGLSCPCGWSGIPKDGPGGPGMKCPACGVVVLPTGTEDRALPEGEFKVDLEAEGPSTPTAPPPPCTLLEMVARAKSRPETLEPVRKFSRWTWVGFWTMVGAPVAGVLGLLAFRKPEEGLLVAVPMFLLAGIALARVIYDLTKPGEANRADPRTAVRAFFRSIAMGWWGGAESFLSWSAQEGISGRRPAIPLLNIESGPVSVGGRPGILEAWRCFTREGRSISGVSVGAPEADGPDAAWLPVELTLSYDIHRAPYGSPARMESGMVRSHVHVRLTARWPVYRQDNRWFVLDPLIPADASWVRV